MKKARKLLALTLCLVLACLALTSCGQNAASSSAAPSAAEAPTDSTPAAPASSEEPAAEPAPQTMTTVRLAVHSNEGAALTAIALEKGFFEKYGVDVKLEIVDSGPPEMAAMRSDNRTLDIGYIGPGVAWNPIDPTGNQLSFVFFDFLGNSERLLARKDVFTDANGDGAFDLEEIYAGLRGQTIYLEVGTTPGMWLLNLVEAVNDGRAEADQLWMECDVDSYLTSYTAPNSDEANKLTVVNYNNANIGAGMSTANASRVDIAVAYSPVTSAVLNTNPDIIAIADNAVMPASKVSVGAWVASNKWIEEDPEIVQAVINALYEGAVYRTEHLDDSMRAGEQLCQKPADSFNTDVVKSISLDEYQEWFGNSDGLGWTYMKALYENRKGAIPEGETPKSFEESCDFSFFTNAIETITSVPN